MFPVMTITLTPAQKAWLEAQVAAGSLPSVEDGVRAAIADLMTFPDDDLEWARPLVDEARQSVAEGRVSDGQELLDSLERRAVRSSCWPSLRRV